VHSTPTSLLERLKVAAPEADEWRRLHEIYSPLIRQWLLRTPGLNGEAPDLAQEVLAVVVRKLPAFERQREGSFRCWLRTITTNQVRNCWKRRKRQPQAGLGDEGHDFIAQLEDPASPLAQQWDREHDRFVLEKLLRAVRGDFSPAVWEAFRRFAVEGQPAAKVAAELNMTVNAVLLAKSRILKRLRQEAAGLLD
jgi:RNA polymerase sigma-70 factor (ECF subfamily)